MNFGRNLEPKNKKMIKINLDLDTRVISHPLLMNPWGRNLKIDLRIHLGESTPLLTNPRREILSRESIQK